MLDIALFTSFIVVTGQRKLLYINFTSLHKTQSAVEIMVLTY